MAQNHIKLGKVHTAYGQEQLLWSIDGKSLPEYLQSWAADFPDNKMVMAMAPFSDLYPAWAKDLECEGDVRFVWETIELDKAVLPLLLCPDDTDFSCIAVMAQVEKTEDFVYWHRVGVVLHDRERPFYQTEGNVFWMKETDWVFDRGEYEDMVQEYWEIETEREMRHFQPREKFTIKTCAEMISRLTRKGWRALEEHLRDYDEILLHLFAGEYISEPLLDMLGKKYPSRRSMEIYCRAIEIMWQYGDEAVVNVVDVTILERLSDEDALWQRFGEYISEEFKEYINTEVLACNLMMCGVRPLVSQANT